MIQGFTEKCEYCYGEGFNLVYCCSGRDCGCMGQPVQFTNCIVCNPKGYFGMSSEEFQKETEHLEYVGEDSSLE